MSQEEVSRAFQVGVFAKFAMIQAVVPHMPRGGRIIDIGSIASKIGEKHYPIYCATKGATDALTFSLSHEVCGSYLNFLFVLLHECLARG